MFGGERLSIKSLSFDVWGNYNKNTYSLMKVELGDWQLKQVSRVEILQVSESLPQYLAPHCGHPTTLPAIGLRHCQQIAAGLLTSAAGLTVGTC